MSKHSFHGAEYVEEHTDVEQEKYANEQFVPIAGNTYGSLEEIVNDMGMFGLNIQAITIREKLKATINAGAYLQKDGRI